jgi:hypothetical protein
MLGNTILFMQLWLKRIISCPPERSAAAGWAGLAPNACEGNRPIVVPQQSPNEYDHVFQSKIENRQSKMASYLFSIRKFTLALAFHSKIENRQSKMVCKCP